MTPQIILLILVGMGLGIALVKHGEENKRKYNFWLEALSSAIMLALLYWGGFFDVFFR
jgi:hypothetical protein